MKNETNRKLASIQRITSLSPIENADKIELAKVLGWQCVVKKDLFKIGDLCIFVEIDSLLPSDNPEFDFMKDTNGKMKMVKTIRLRGVLSQGLCFPLEVIKGFEKKEWISNITGIIEGQDLTDVIGITKWEPQESNEGNKGLKGSGPLYPRPSWIYHTDEPRIQSCFGKLKKYFDPNILWYVTEKLNGSSTSYAINGYEYGGEFYVCSHNSWKKLEDDSCYFWEVAKKQNIEEKLRKVGKNIIIQGELVGPSIQKNTLKKTGREFYCFNVINLDTGRFYNYEEFITFCKEFDIPTVPIIDINRSLNGITSEDLLMGAQKNSVLVNDLAEGFVIRPMKEIWDEKLGRISFKVLNNEYLLKYGN